VQIVVVDNHVTVLEEYDTNYRTEGIAWDGTRFWSCDHDNRETRFSIYKHSTDSQLSIVKEYPAPRIYDITFVEGELWSVGDKFYRHLMDDNLTVYKEHERTDNITWGLGMAYDGNALWICGKRGSGFENYIAKYQINDSDISLIATYQYSYGGTFTGMTWTQEGLLITSYWYNDVFYSLGSSPPNSLEDFSYALKAPYDWPSGMTYDGENVWLLDLGGSDNDGNNEPRADIGKIMKIALPDKANQSNINKQIFASESQIVSNPGPVIKTEDAKDNFK